MESSKWIAAVASIWIQCSCGASFAFGIYSPILKSSQGYDQSTLDTVSVFKDIGANAGILSGLLYAAVSKRSRRTPSSWLAGPWVVHLVGAVMCFVGFSFLWLAITGTINRPPVPAMCLFMFLAAHAQTFFNTANVVTAVQNFPGYTGTVVGLMKGFLGLSGAVLIQVYETVLGSEPTNFVLMLALVPTLVSLLLMFFVRVHEDTQSTVADDKRYINAFALISMIVATYLMFLIFFNNILALPHWFRAITVALLLLLLLSPITIAIRAHYTKGPHNSQTLLKTPLIEEGPIPKLPEIITVVPLEMNLVQAMGTLNFWLLFITMVCGMGSGLSTINNISQIGESLGYSPRARNGLISLWSIWNFSGRFGAGYVSDIFMHKKGLARPYFITLTLAVMTVGHVIIGSGFPGNLYAGTVLVGICFGSLWSLMPTIASEIFGMLHMGTIFNTVAIASPLGSYILSVRVIGYMYDKKAALGGGNTCSGRQCFMMSYFVLASVSLFGFFMSLVLVAKTRAVYAGIVRSRLWARGV